MNRQDELEVLARYPGERHSVKEFVQPKCLMVQEAVAGLVNPSLSTDEAIISCWKFITEQIVYPYSNGAPTDYHRMEAYEGNKRFIPGVGWRTSPRVVLETTGDFWEMPFEVLNPNSRVADCDGKSITLASMLRTFIDPVDVHVAVGNIISSPPSGHAWVRLRRNSVWFNLETTLPKLPKNLWRTEEELENIYQMCAAFNDQEIWVSPCYRKLLSQNTNGQVLLNAAWCPNLER